VKNRTGQNRWKTDVETVQLVRELARTLPDQSIAPVLNRLGIRSAKGNSWSQLRVRNLRSVHQIAVYREGERVERHELILHEAASRLGVSKMTVVRLIRDRLLPARQACVGAPYVIREDDLDRPALRRALTQWSRSITRSATRKSVFSIRSRGTASCHHPVRLMRGPIWAIFCVSTRGAQPGSKSDNPHFGKLGKVAAECSPGG